MQRFGMTRSCLRWMPARARPGGRKITQGVPAATDNNKITQAVPAATDTVVVKICGLLLHLFLGLFKRLVLGLTRLLCRRAHHRVQLGWFGGSSVWKFEVQYAMANELSALGNFFMGLVPSSAEDPRIGGAVEAMTSEFANLAKSGELDATLAETIGRVRLHVFATRLRCSGYQFLKKCDRGHLHGTAVRPSQTQAAQT